MRLLSASWRIVRIVPHFSAGLRQAQPPAVPFGMTAFLWLMVLNHSAGLYGNRGRIKGVQIFQYIISDQK